MRTSINRSFVLALIKIIRQNIKIFLKVFLGFIVIAGISILVSYRLIGEKNIFNQTIYELHIIFLILLLFISYYKTNDKTKKIVNLTFIFYSSFISIIATLSFFIRVNELQQNIFLLLITVLVFLVWRINRKLNRIKKILIDFVLLCLIVVVSYDVYYMSQIQNLFNAIDCSGTEKIPSNNTVNGKVIIYLDSVQTDVKSEVSYFIFELNNLYNPKDSLEYYNYFSVSKWLFINPYPSIKLKNKIETNIANFHYLQKFWHIYKTDVCFGQTYYKKNRKTGIINKVGKGD